MFSVKIKRKSNTEFKHNTVVQTTDMSERTATLESVACYLCKGYFPLIDFSIHICRYHVHPKLVNFMAPKETCNWSDEAR